ncbi:MAG: alpha/beta hydrolase [Geminicoccaceae bacterium]|nr:alpha/beta hydrolase [Geminicoccaceae bacterium]
MDVEPAFLEPEPGRRIAYARLPGEGPEIVFLCGLRSDMSGTKASRLAALARARGWAFTRFDYRGHGASSGRFEEGTIGAWHADTLLVLDRVVEGPFLLVGSSMGGWQALLAGLARPQRLAGMVLVAPAPDFPRRLVLPALSPAQREALEREGVVLLPSEYGEPLPLTRRFVEESIAHELLDRDLPFACPVHILHGRQDRDVPLSLSLALIERLVRARVTLEVIEDGDHRLSRESDLLRLEAAVARVRAVARGEPPPVG